MLRRLLIVSLVAGLAAGALATLLQAALLTPLIHAAEQYESGEAQPAHAHEEAGLERFAFTLAANLLVGVGFALLLNAAIALRGGAMSAGLGALWGLAGFAAFSLAPALGLPPELPGSHAADLAARQLWWLGAAAATAGGLALLAFGRSRPLQAGAVLLLAAPHLLGAPAPEQMGGSAPPELAAHFAVLSLVAAALFWAALGGLSGLLHSRRPL
jgi:cobalt transporter subunit CbtA